MVKMLSSRSASSREQIIRHVPPQFNFPGVLERLPGILEFRRYPFVPNLLQAVGVGADAVTLTGIIESQNRDWIYFININGERFVVKVFRDPLSGWAEANMVDLIHQQSPIASYGKLRPLHNGRCIIQLGENPENDVVSYFSLMRNVGVPVFDLIDENVEINWPAEIFCSRIFLMLRAFAVSHPTTCTIKFYHGDANASNYLFDVSNRTLYMTDFGRSYFRWQRFFVSPRRDSVPRNGSHDVKTFYDALLEFLKLRNIAMNNGIKTQLKTFFGVDESSIYPPEEPNRFALLCAELNIALDLDLPN